MNLRCYQSGAFVYDAWHGFFASYAPDPNFTLASGLWTSGAADCTAGWSPGAGTAASGRSALLHFHAAA